MGKDLNYWKKNAEEDYMKVPISVLRYITELEKVVLPQAVVLKSVCEHKNKRQSETMSTHWFCHDCNMMINKQTVL